MGCNIHATIEYDRYYNRRVHRGETDVRHYWWSFAKSVDIDRGYYFFGLLAGVRNTHINSIALPRGVPEDASHDFESEYKEWGADGHTPSWVLFSELRDWRHLTGDFDFDPEEDMKKQDFYKVMEMLAERYGDENVRLCFFFDN